MPRENRKRGKKHKKKAEEEAEPPVESYAPQSQDQEDETGPSWIVRARDDSAVDLNAPFGYVDAKVKAYFRTVDVQIREWQESRPEVEADEDVDPNEGARNFGSLYAKVSHSLYRPSVVLCSGSDGDV